MLSFMVELRYSELLMASPLIFRNAASELLTVDTLINDLLKSTPLSDQFEKQACVKHMEAEPGVEQITTFWPGVDRGT